MREDADNMKDETMGKEEEDKFSLEEEEIAGSEGREKKKRKERKKDRKRE